MRLHLWGTPAETVEAAGLLGELFGLTVTSLTRPEPGCGYAVAEVPSPDELCVLWGEAA